MEQIENLYEIIASLSNEDLEKLKVKIEEFENSIK